MIFNRTEILLRNALNERNDLNNFLKSDKSLLEIFDLSINLSEERLKKYKKLYSFVGNTPAYMLKLKNKNKLFIKMECMNKMGNSHYSRYWLIYLFLAEELNIITPGNKKIIEITSGSSGIALSMAAKKLNYNVLLIVPEVIADIRIKPMLDFGAEVIRVKGYINECNIKLKELFKANPGKFHYPNHSEEPCSIIASVFSRISYEFLNKYNPPDYLSLGLGNGSSLYSVATVLKNHNADCKVIGFHPDVKNTNIVYGLIPKLDFDMKHVTKIDNENIIDYTIYTDELSLKKVIKKYFFDTEVANLGHSSLYAVSAILKFIKKNNISGKTFFSIGYDRINRY